MKTPAEKFRKANRQAASKTDWTIMRGPIKVWVLQIDLEESKANGTMLTRLTGGLQRWLDNCSWHFDTES